MRLGEGIDSRDDRTRMTSSHCNQVFLKQMVADEARESDQSSGVIQILFLGRDPYAEAKLGFRFSIRPYLTVWYHSSSDPSRIESG